MKVLQIIPDLSPGGTEGFITNLGVGLAAMGAEVRFFLMAGVRGERGEVLFERLKRSGVEVVGAEPHNVRSPMNLVRLARLIRTWRPDVVQANLYSAEVLVAAARFITDGKSSRYVRRLVSTEIVGYRSEPIVRAMDRIYDLTIACSPSVENAYRTLMGANQRSKIVTILNGGCFQQYTTTYEEKQIAREALGMPRGAFVVAHVGGMFRVAIGTGLEYETKPIKGHDVLLKAFARAFAGDRSCFLILIGDGPLRADLQTLARDFGIAEQTRFLGQQAEPWLALNAADMFCFPSRYEGLPNALLEAASCGLPVVASDIPEIRGINSGGAWLLCPPDSVDAFADGLLSMRARMEVFKPLASETAQWVRENYSMETCAKRYLDAYLSDLV